MESLQFENSELGDEANKSRLDRVRPKNLEIAISGFSSPNYKLQRCESATIPHKYRSNLTKNANSNGY
jgi:hypothetical protein